MQHIDLKRSQGQQMSQPNIGKKKVPGSTAAAASEISHSGERAQHTLNEERLLFEQNKNPSVFGS